MAGFGSLAKPYVENPFAGWITKVHWRRGEIVCGGTATAAGVGPWPFNGTSEYSGTGDLNFLNPLQVSVSGCREGQPWSLSVECVLSMVLGPLQADGVNHNLPNLAHCTKDATYSAEFGVWTVEDGALGVLLSSASLSGSLHQEAIYSVFNPGAAAVTDEVSTTIALSGTGYTVFAFVAEWSADPDPTTDPKGANVGVGGTFGALSVSDDP